MGGVLRLTFCLVTVSFLLSFLNEEDRVESTLVAAASAPSLQKPRLGVMLTFLFCSSWAARELDEAWARGWSNEYFVKPRHPAVHCNNHVNG